MKITFIRPNFLDELLPKYALLHEAKHDNANMPVAAAEECAV